MAQSSTCKCLALNYTARMCSSYAWLIYPKFGWKVYQHRLGLPLISATTLQLGLEIGSQQERCICSSTHHSNPKSLPWWSSNPKIIRHVRFPNTPGYRVSMHSPISNPQPRRNGWIGIWPGLIGVEWMSCHRLQLSIRMGCKGRCN